MPYFSFYRLKATLAKLGSMNFSRSIILPISMTSCMYLWILSRSAASGYRPSQRIARGWEKNNFEAPGGSDQFSFQDPENRRQYQRPGPCRFLCILLYPPEGIQIPGLLPMFLDKVFLHGHNTAGVVFPAVCRVKFQVTDFAFDGFGGTGSATMNPPTSSFSFMMPGILMGGTTSKRTLMAFSPGDPWFKA